MVFQVGELTLTKLKGETDGSESDSHEERPEGR